jgi:hypothetical protein
MIQTSKCNVSQTASPISEPFEACCWKKEAEQNEIHEDYLLIIFFQQCIKSCCCNYMQSKLQQSRYAITISLIRLEIIGATGITTQLQLSLVCSCYPKLLLHRS